MLRVRDVARARQLIAFLSLLARALAVALAGDHGVAAAFTADSPAGDYQVDGGNAVVHAFAVVLDAARMQQEAGRRRPPHLGGACTIISGGTPAILAEYSGVYFFTASATSFEIGGVLRDEVAVDPTALDHDVQHPVEYAYVAAGTHRNEEVGVAGNRSHPGIENDQLAAVLACLPQIVRGDWRAFGDVRACNQNHFGFGNVGPGIGAAIDAKDLLRRRARGNHAQPAVVVDVGSAQRDPGKLAHQVGFLVSERSARQHRE